MNNENNNINNLQNPDVSNINNGVPVINPEPVINQVNTPVISEPVVNPEPVVSAPVVNPVDIPVVNPEPVISEPMVNQVTTPVVNPTPVISQESTPINPTPIVTDNNTMVNENLKKVEIKDYTPPSKLKIIILLIFFVLLIVFIIFLPNIYDMVKNYRSGVHYQKDEVVTTGKLICTLNTNTATLDKDYELVFNFKDSKLKDEKFVVTSRSDSTVDESELSKLAESCNSLKNETDSLDGVYIRCDYSDNKLVETQSFDLEKVDTQKLDAAFTETGGTMPTYQLDQDIDGIEKNMKASSYTCQRQR